MTPLHIFHQDQSQERQLKASVKRRPAPLTKYCLALSFFLSRGNRPAGVHSVQEKVLGTYHVPRVPRILGTQRRRTWNCHQVLGFAISPPTTEAHAVPLPRMDFPLFTLQSHGKGSFPLNSQVPSSSRKPPITLQGSPGHPSFHL